MVRRSQLGAVEAGPFAGASNSPQRRPSRDASSRSPLRWERSKQIEAGLKARAPTDVPTWPPPVVRIDRLEGSTENTEQNSIKTHVVISHHHAPPRKGHKRKANRTFHTSAIAGRIRGGGYKMWKTKGKGFYFASERDEKDALTPLLTSSLLYDDYVFFPGGLLQRGKREPVMT